MSYSFTVTAGSKAEAKQMIAASFDGVVAAQPTHAKDKAAAVACGQAFVDMLVDPGVDSEICVSMYGSVSWNTGQPDAFLAASATVNASIRPKAATA